MLDSNKIKEIIAKNIALELKPNSYINLGVGVPTLVANYITPEQNIILHAENGLVGTGRDLTVEEAEDLDVISSSEFPATYMKGAAFMDSSLSFGIIRGKHLDATVLGTMEVDQEGNIANYIIPNKLVSGMGGAMDLCVGARNVIVATTHTNKGKAKILKKCTIPLTAQKVVTKIVTEKAIFDVKDNHLELVGYNPLFTVEDILKEVKADVIVSENLREMSI